MASRLQPIDWSNPQSVEIIEANILQNEQKKWKLLH
jgi:hypothetical protein